MKLVIVESPTKCETIKRYLGNDYLVIASKGHIRDLSTRGERGLGIDIQNNFAPTYVVSKKQIGIVKELKEKARKAEEVILATDPDREGEAIAWHLAQELKLPLKTTKRLEFHEITRDSINKAINEPRFIDMDLVSSQEARRIIDRIIGFDLSSLIKKRIGSKSAGRVQSSALNLIAEHDKEIANFIPQEYYEITAKAIINDNYDIKAIRVDKQKINLHSATQANEVFASLKDDVKVINIKKKVVKVESKDPFTTSSLQQEAFNHFRFSASKTLKVAQSLYEGLDVNGEHMGLITYMRTDSNRLSPTFIGRAHAFIKEKFGEEYIGVKKGQRKESKLAQDGHEAIRPTKNHNTPESVKNYLKPDQFNLYKLIYNRALESLMKAKTEEKMLITLQSGRVEFDLEFSRVVDLGYEILEGKSNKTFTFPNVNIDDSFPIIDKKLEQKFTQPPSHYSEAKMVQLMEEKGIGRPSTYATTIETLKERSYVNEDNGLLSLTSQGDLTNTVLNKYFPDIVDVKYTADMEQLLDNIASGDAKEIEVLSDFYKKFREEYLKATETMKKEGQIIVEDHKCPECGSDLVYAAGKNGRYIRCTNKKCHHTESDPTNGNNAGVLTKKKCEKCGSFLLKKKGQYGVYYVCSNTESCDFKISAKALMRKKIFYKKK